MLLQKAKSTFNRLYEPYDLKTAHKARLEKRQPREQIIREYDWENLPEWFTDRWHVDFFILTKEYFKRWHTWYLIQGDKKLAEQYALYDYPERMMSTITNICFWIPTYSHWLIKYNDNDEMVVRTHITNPDSRLGFGTFTEIQ